MVVVDLCDNCSEPLNYPKEPKMAREGTGYYRLCSKCFDEWVKGQLTLFNPSKRYV